MSVCLVYVCSSWLHYLTITIIYSQRQSLEALTLYLQTQGSRINPLNAELNPICHLLALLWAHHILHVSRIRVKEESLYFLSHCS